MGSERCCSVWGRCSSASPPHLAPASKDTSAGGFSAWLRFNHSRRQTSPVKYLQPGLLSAALVVCIMAKSYLAFVSWKVLIHAAKENGRVLATRKWVSFGFKALQNFIVTAAVIQARHIHTHTLLSPTFKAPTIFSNSIPRLVLPRLFSR